MTKQELAKALTMPQFPRSVKYDVDWLCANEMGPCSIWLCEFLMDKMNLKPGMRVLDMGCGMGMTSVFLAREYGVNVIANDLWIPASENWVRFKEAGLENSIIPIHAEAHDLPYADDYFDAIVSIDSYHYYGTDVLYLDYLTRFLRKDGKIGIIVPGLTREFDKCVPDNIKPHWYNDMYTFHTPEWWEILWNQSTNISTLSADLMPGGFDVWSHWEHTLLDSGNMKRGGDTALLDADRGEYLTFSRIVGVKR